MMARPGMFCCPESASRLSAGADNRKLRLRISSRHAWSGRNNRVAGPALIGTLAMAALMSTAAAQALNVRADPAQIEAWINGLAQFTAEGPGTSRVAYTRADIEGRRYLIDEMEKLGLEVRIDAAGNIIGRRAGQQRDLPVIMTGSHSDTVPEGGNYDGSAGVVAAMEVVRLLNEAEHATRHPIEIVVLQNEEGGLLGSMGLTGQLGEQQLATVSQSGHTIAEGIGRIGGDPDDVASAARQPGDLAAFIELHIEQGKRLVDSGDTIGVVQGIVGIHWWDVIVEGDANHAGTTPMRGRKDALVTAAKLIQEVRDIGTDTPGTQVATVGRIRAEPGAPNVIPGKVVMSLEVRDLELVKMEQIFATIENAAQRIAAADGTTIRFVANKATTNSPAPTDPRVRDLIANAAESLGYGYRRLPSMAGHDTQNMARIAPTGMIFVPSRGGYSHSPKEFTSAADLAKGADVLLETILQIDQGALEQ